MQAEQRLEDDQKYAMDSSWAALEPYQNSADTREDLGMLGGLEEDHPLKMGLGLRPQPCLG